MSAAGLDTPRLVLRQWREADRGSFAAINADPAVMEFFPSLQDRAASDAMIDGWRAQIDAQGWGNWAVERRDSGELAGFVGLTRPRRALPFTPCVEVGWRLGRAHWGRGFATEAARTALAYGFENAGLAEIVSFTALVNRRSVAVMEKIGMANARADFDHPALPEGHVLRRHCLYRLRSEDWRRDPVALVAFDPAMAAALVPMWRESFEAALGIHDPHPLVEQQAYLLEHVAPFNSIRVAVRGGEIVGFIAASPRGIAQLYVRRGYQRLGLGTRMLRWAQERSDGWLQLHTFARNAAARAFYERHGFRATVHGFEPRWQLDDVRYEWSRP